MNSNKCISNVRTKYILFIVTISSFKFINTANRKKYCMEYIFSVQLFRYAIRKPE